MVPFLIVAVSLGMAQMRRTPMLVIPDIAVHAPVERVALAPPPVTVALPLSVQPTPAIPYLAAPGTAPTYPSPVPTVEAVSVTTPVIASPAPAPLMSPQTIPYPPPQPEIAVASLNVGPPIATPVTPPTPPVAIAPLQPPAPVETACSPTAERLASFSQVGRLARAPRQPRLAGIDAETFGKRLSAAALAQTEDLVIYTARYQPMAYPMGDVMALHGACIDVVIRAYRTLGIDLQEEVQRSRPSRGDPNIDHRRTENMRRFLEKHGTSMPVTNFPENYKPGDIVTYYRPFSRVSTSHIAVVTDVLAATGRPMIVHNRGYGAQLEDALFVDRITGHYRYMGQPGTGQNNASNGAPQLAPVVRASFPAR